jgi:hypothetical protein
MQDMLPKVADILLKIKFDFTLHFYYLHFIGPCNQTGVL